MRSRLGKCLTNHGFFPIIEMIFWKGGAHHDFNVSAQQDPSGTDTRIQTENENGRRPEGSGGQKSKRQKAVMRIRLQ